MMRFLLISMLLLLTCGCSTSRTVWISAADQAGMARLTESIQLSPVIFVGEFHDRASHHDLQLQVIKALRVKGIPLVIGLEMFDIESQPALNRWSAGDLAIDDFARLYKQNWTIAWTQYDRILLYARNQRISLVGINAPLDLVNRVSRYGWESLRTEDKARLPAGVTPAIADDYIEFLNASFGDHTMPPALFDNFCAAQGLRNNSMALQIKKSLAEHPGATVVVITGIGHAIRRGISHALGPDLAAKAKIVVPYEEGIFSHISENDVDYIITE